MTLPIQAQLRAIYAMTMVIMLSACGTVVTREQQDWLPQTASAMDELAGILEEYGTVTISSPLIAAPDDKFAFELTRETGTNSAGEPIPLSKADGHYAAAKSEVQGSAAVFDQRLRTVNVSGRVDLDRTRQAAYDYNVQRLLQKDAENADRRALLTAAAQNRLDAALELAEAKETPAEKSAARESAYANYYDNIKAIEDTGGPERFPTAANVEGQPEPPTIPDTPPLLAEAGASSRAKALTERLAGFQALLGAPTPSVRNRSALITAAGDTAVEAIFGLLGKPAEAGRFKGKVKAFGVSTVSVVPGWRTRQDFAARLAVEALFSYEGQAPASVVAQVLRDARVPDSIKQKLRCSHVSYASCSSAHDRVNLGTLPAEYLGHSKALNDKLHTRAVKAVASVSPLTDVQTLDLELSRRERSRFALLLQLAFQSAGATAAAEVFADFARQTETDFRTRTAEAPVSSFSTGTVFGYEVGPVIKALSPGRLSRKSRPVYELQRQAFPVLLIFGFEQEDLGPRIVCLGEALDLSKPCAGKVAIRMPQLLLIQSPRWTPLEKAGGRYRLSESRLIKLRQRVRIAEKAIGDFVSLSEKTLAKRRLVALRQQVFGSFYAVSIPTELADEQARPPSRVVASYPKSISLAADAKGKPQSADHLITVLGDGLGDVDAKQVAVVSGAATVKAVSAGDREVAVTVTVTDASEGPVVLVLRPDDATGTGVATVVVPVTLERSAN